MKKTLKPVRRAAMHLRNRVRGQPLRDQRSANSATIEFLKTTGGRQIAEIGVEWGSTSVEILNWLGGEGRLHLFDFEDRREPISNVLKDSRFTNYVFHGNSRRTLDSYNWSLMKLLQENPEPLLDYVYLDGAHVWAIDALAFCLVDRLLKPGGYIDFDDYGWTIAGSPTVNPRVFPAMKRLYSDEQMEAPQVRLIVDLLVRRDHRYIEVVPNKIFRKA